MNIVKNKLEWKVVFYAPLKFIIILVAVFALYFIGTLYEKGGSIIPIFEIITAMILFASPVVIGLLVSDKAKTKKFIHADLSASFYSIAFIFLLQFVPARLQEYSYILPITDLFIILLASFGLGCLGAYLQKL